MSEMVKNKGVDIIFRSQSGEINRVAASSDREAQAIIKERQGLGDIPIASTADSEAIGLTEKYRIQESRIIFPFRR